MKEELVDQIEALLFASGRHMSLDILSSLTMEKKVEVEEALNSLKTNYENNSRVLKITQDSHGWKLNVREKFIPIVRKVTSETELPKTVLETLAVVAWKNPALQSDIIKIRTNKAYEHLDQLEEDGFLVRKKHGRTKKITLTDKFFRYFELPKHKNGKILPKEILEKIKKVEEEIASGENAIKSPKKEEKIKNDNSGDLILVEEPEIDLDGEKLKTYESTEVIILGKKDQIEKNKDTDKNNQN